MRVRADLSERDNYQMTVNFSNIGVIGAGAMGRGIAQIAAQAGSTVLLLDSFDGRQRAGATPILAQWDRLQEKAAGCRAAQALSARVRAVGSMQALADCDLVVEAMVEHLDVKASCSASSKPSCRPTAVLATNTSSLSVTAIAAALKQPQRLAGYHFFNPVPLMKVVEVVAGLKTRRRRSASGSPATPRRWATAGAGAGHARLHRQPRGPRLRHRGAAHRRRRRGGLRDDRPHPEGPGRLQARPLRTDGPDGAGRLASGDGVDLPPVLRGAALPAQRDHGAAAGRRRARAARPAKASTAMRTGKAAGAPSRRCPTVDAMPPVWVSPRAARRPELYQLLQELGAKLETGATPSSRRADPGGAAGLRRDHRGRGRAARPGAHASASTCWSTTRPPSAACWPPTPPPGATCAMRRMRCSRATARPSA